VPEAPRPVGEEAGESTEKAGQKMPDEEMVLREKI